MPFARVPFFIDLIYLYARICVYKACDKQIMDRLICVQQGFNIINPSATSVPFNDTESVHAAHTV